LISARSASMGIHSTYGESGDLNVVAHARSKGHKI